MNKYKLIIELQSDLCPGSGFDYAGVIDSDVCADSYGLPYIPARRLKGCFRETAETICGLSGEKISSLFGTRGNDGTKGFVIKNAYLEDHTALRSALESKGWQNHPEEVLEQFTSVRAQTRLSEGVARKETLRYTRVIDCRNSIYDGNVRFVSDLFCDPDQFSTLQIIVKCTKNIGMHRNRGLGSVRCRLLDSDQSEAAKLQDNLQHDDSKESGSKTDSGSYEEGQQYKITFSVLNIDPLEISADSNTSSLSYINGASVRGCLAANYLRMYPDKPVEEFERIFLKETIFNNLYPSVGNKLYYPAPLNLRRLKKTKDLVNLLAEGERVTDGDAGNRPQKIKTGFVRSEHDRYDLCETEMQLQYHHRTGSPDEALLYALETIAPGQTFRGTILTDGRNVDLIRELIETGNLSFGKSKTAQYGQCVLIERPTPEKCNTEGITDPAGRYVLTFASDALIRSRTTGDYTTKREEVMEEVVSAFAKCCDCRKEDLSIPEELKACGTVNGAGQETEEKVTPCWFETRMIYGYNTRWNLKRPSLPGVSAGSCLVLKVENTPGRIPAEFYMGDRQQEGFGHILVSAYSGQTYSCRMILNIDDNPKQRSGSNNTQNEASVEALGGSRQSDNKSGEKLLNALNMDSLENELLKDAFTGKPLNISKTALGRATLMLRESYRESVSGQKTCKEFLSSLADRFDSIRTESVKTAVDDFKEKSRTRFKSILEQYKTSHNYEPSDIQKRDLLYRFMLTRLTAEKYRKKQTGKGGDKG